MPKQILLAVTALLVAVSVASSPAQASVPTPAHRNASASAELPQGDLSRTAKEHLALRMSEAAPPPPPDCNGLPCWPNCKYQTFPCWDVEDTNFLTLSSSDDMPTLCLGERLQLGSGQYDWGYIWEYEGFKVLQNRYVGAGWYGMSACIDPRGGNRYTFTMGLWPDNPAWQPWVFSRDFYVSGGYYRWGAYLDPLF